MKTLIPLTALVALVATGSIHAQTPAYSKPSGYVTMPLKQGFNLLGLSLQTASLASGSFETVTATTLTDNGVTYAPVSGRTYVMEITSGTISGSIFEVPAASISGSTITITTSPATDLVALGLTTNDTYNLRIAPTLEEVFTTNALSGGGVLVAGIPSGADIVWLANGAGGYNKYFLRSGTFRAVLAPTVSTPNVPIIYTDGFYVEKKTSAVAALTTTGNVKTIGSTSVIVQGFNPVSIVAPVGLNLFNAGFEDDMQQGIPSAADIIWVQDPSNLSFQRYFRRSNSWRNFSAPSTILTQSQLEAIVLSGAVLFEKKGVNATNLDLLVPSNYTGL